jgi:hypothetical protein
MQSKPYVAPAVAEDFARPLRAVLWAWLACGCLALACFPALRGYNETLGWLPFWLVVAPLIDLAIVRRRWIATTSRAFLVRARRRRRSAPRQALAQRRRPARVKSRPQLAPTLANER